ncbi:ABC transporter permease [Halorubellus sp. PRR65]|uniref:ABC transporter permease n=1 Tax=Halorubellus sp. PRR65 TaxID=3098148 RepID=UPI002B261351|nr:ABC transporter permease [Halorubellus sp. PRR65]
MNRTYVLRRVGVAALSLYAVVTLVFVAVVLVPDPAPAVLNYYNVNADQIPALIAAKGGTQPLLDRYVAYLGNLATLDWGRSVSRLGSIGPPVTTLIARHAPYTLLYVVPALLVGFASGVGLGAYAALRRGGYVDRAVRSVGYLAFGVPNFVVAQLALVVLSAQLGLVEFTLGTSQGKYYTQGAPVDVWTADALVQFGIVATILAITLAGGQVRYARSECLEYATDDFVRLARAKGASDWRIAAGVVRTAGLPLLTGFLDDVVTTLLVHAFVLEFVFDLPGLGQLGLVSVKARDVSTTMGLVVVVVTGAIILNLCQDLGMGVVDPRVDAD